MSTAQATVSPSSSKEVPATLADIINVNAALGQLLEQETQFMDKMQLTKINEIQERKLKLTAMLERYMRYVGQHPEVVLNATAEEKTEMKKIATSFKSTMKKNYDTLLVARSVNREIVKYVTKTISGRSNNPVYNAHGATIAVKVTPISMTLNQTI